MIYLHAVGNFLAVRQDLCQVLGPQDISQSGLRQQPGSSICIGDVCHSQNGVLHPVVHHAVNADRHRIFGQHLDSRTGKVKKKKKNFTDELRGGTGRTFDMIGNEVEPYLLRRDVEGDGAHVHVNQAVGARQNEEEAWRIRMKANALTMAALALKRNNEMWAKAAAGEGPYGALSYQGRW